MHRRPGRSRPTKRTCITCARTVPEGAVPRPGGEDHRTRPDRCETRGDGTVGAGSRRRETVRTPVDRTEIFRLSAAAHCTPARRGECAARPGGRLPTVTARAGTHQRGKRGPPAPTRLFALFRRVQARREVSRRFSFQEGRPDRPARPGDHVFCQQGAASRRAPGALVLPTAVGVTASRRAPRALVLPTAVGITAPRGRCGASRGRRRRRRPARAGPARAGPSARAPP